MSATCLEMQYLRGFQRLAIKVCNTLITSSNLVVASEESSKDGSFFYFTRIFGILTV